MFIAHTGYLELFDLVVKHILPGMGLLFYFVLYVQGIPDDMQLPDTVGGAVMGYDAHTTLPIAAGKIQRV